MLKKADGLTHVLQSVLNGRPTSHPSGNFLASTTSRLTAMSSFFMRPFRKWRSQTYELSAQVVPDDATDDADGGPVVLDLTQKKFRRTDLQLLCILLVCLSALFSMTAVASGIYIVLRPQDLPSFLHHRLFVRNFLGGSDKGLTKYYLNHYIWACHPAVYWVILVAFTSLVTAFLDAHGRISSTALLWWKSREDGTQLRYNSNSHLMCSTKKFGPCHGSVNILAGLTIATSYGAAASSLANVEVYGTCDDTGACREGDVPGSDYAIDISGYALIILGASLFVQCLISSWTLAHILVLEQYVVKTFSSNPVVNTLFMRQFMPVDLPIAEIETFRRTAHEQVRRARVYVRGLWCGTAALALSCFIAAILAAKKGTFDPAIYDGDVWGGWGYNERSIGESSADTDWAGPLLQSLMQGYLAFLMHCSDTVVSMLNDENNWQRSMPQLEADQNYWMPRKYWLRWRSILLFVGKSSVQWIFGVAIAVDIWFWVSLVPLVVATVLVLIIVATLEWMIRVKPKGKQPSTYGEFALMLKHIAYCDRIQL